MSQYYVGIDLHTRSAQFCILDAQGVVVLEQRTACDLMDILEVLSPFGRQIQIAVKSTYNWYWLVDGLMESGYNVRLAQAYGLRLITGAEVKTNRRDAYSRSISAPGRVADYLHLTEGKASLPGFTQATNELCTILIRHINDPAHSTAPV